MQSHFVLNTEFYAKSSYSGKNALNFPIDVCEITSMDWNAEKQTFRVWFKFNASLAEKKAAPKSMGLKQLELASWWARGYFAGSLDEANALFQKEQKDALICQLITVHKVPKLKYVFAKDPIANLVNDIFIYKKPELMPFIQKFGEKQLPKNEINL